MSVVYWRNNCSGTIPKDSSVIHNELTTAADQKNLELARVLFTELKARANIENATMDVPNHWKLSQNIFASMEDISSSSR